MKISAFEKQVVVHAEKAEDTPSETDKGKASIPQTRIMGTSHLEELWESKMKNYALEILIQGQSPDGYYRIDKETRIEVLKSIRDQDHVAFEKSVKDYMQQNPSEHNEGEYKAFLEEMRATFHEQNRMNLLIAISIAIKHLIISGSSTESEMVLNQIFMNKTFKNKLKKY